MTPRPEAPADRAVRDGATAGPDGVQGEPPTTRTKVDRPVVVIGLLMAALGALVAYEGYRVGARRVVFGLSPGGMPTVVGVGLAVLGVLVVIQGSRGMFPPRDRDAPAPVLWIVGGLVAQIALLTTAGFSVATGLVFAATAKGMGRGPLWATVPIGIVIAFALYVVFSQGLDLALPAGPPERFVFDLINPPAPPPAPAPAP